MEFIPSAITVCTVDIRGKSHRCVPRIRLFVYLKLVMLISVLFDTTQKVNQAVFAQSRLGSCTSAADMCRGWTTYSEHLYNVIKLHSHATHLYDAYKVQFIFRLCKVFTHLCDDLTGIQRGSSQDSCDSLR